VLTADHVVILVLDSILHVSVAFLTAVTEAAFLLNVTPKEYDGFKYELTAPAK